MLKTIDIKKVNSDLRFACKRINKTYGTYQGLYYVFEEQKYNYVFEFVYLKIEKNINNYAYFIDNRLVNLKTTKEKLKNQFSILNKEIKNEEELKSLLDKINVNFLEKEKLIIVSKDELKEKVKLIENIRNF